MPLKGKPLLLTTSDQDLYVCPATQEASVHALVFSNVTAGAVNVTIKRYIAALATTTTIVDARPVNAKDTFTWPKPMNLAVGDKIIASASANSSIVADHGVYESGATPAAVGFTGRGAWSSATAYVANDVVTYNSNSYLAIAAGTNQNPASATAYWMLLAAQGPAGTGDVTTNTAQTITGAKRGAVTSDNDLSFDMSAGNNFTCTPTGAGTLTFTNIVAGQSGFITLINGSNYTISKAAAVKMATGALTQISATGRYLLSYHSSDGTNVDVTVSAALS